MSGQTGLSKKCRHRSEAMECSVWNSKFLTFRLIPFSEGAWCTGNRKSKKLFHFPKLWVPLPLSGQFQQRTNWWCFLIFSQKTGFDISWKLSPNEKICMKCQILFSQKKKKNILMCHLLTFLPSMLSIKWFWWYLDYFKIPEHSCLSILVQHRVVKRKS